MWQVFLACICFLSYIFIYFIIGASISKVCKFNNDPVHHLFYGLFFYGAMFFVYVMPLKLMLVPADRIAYIWALIIFLLCLILTILNRKYMKEGIIEKLKYIKNHKASFLIITVLILGEIIFIEFFGRLLGGFNQVWFVGWVSNGVVHNELMTYDTASGLPLQRFDNDRYLCTFMDHSVIACKLFGLHPMVEVRTVLTAVFVLFQCLLVWEMAKYFAKGKTDTSIFFYLVFWSIRNIMGFSHLLPGFYTYFRTYEGKGFVMNIPIPLILFLFWKMYEKPEDNTNLLKSCIVLIGSMTYSLSMMFTFPFLLAAYVPFLLSKKDKKLFRNIFVLGCICGVYFVVYYLGRIGKLDLTIHR